MQKLIDNLDDDCDYKDASYIALYNTLHGMNG
jgi:hypothetical protein